MNFTEKVLTTFLSKVAVLIISIPASIIIARALGPTGKGTYALVLLLPALLIKFGNFGIDVSNVYYSAGQKFKLKDIAGNSLVFSLTNGISLIILFLIFLYLFPTKTLGEINLLYLYIAILSVPFSLLNIYMMGILLGKQKIKELNLVSVISSLSSSIGIALLLIFLKQGVFSVILLSLVLAVTTSLVSFSLVNKLEKIKLSFNLEVFKKTVSFGIKSYLANILHFLNLRLDMFLVNYFVGITQLGYYSVAVSLAEMIWYIPQSISTILFPEVSASQEERSKELTAMLCRHTVFITLLLCLALGIMGKPIIKILYGSDFLPSLTPLLILLPGIFFISFEGILGSYIIGRGKPIYNTYGAFGSLIINTSFNLLLIPKIGILGAALSTTLTYVLGVIYGIIIFLILSKSKLLDILIIKPKDFKTLSKLFHQKPLISSLIRKQE